MAEEELPTPDKWNGAERRSGEVDEEKRVRALVRSEVEGALDGFMAKLDLIGSDDDEDDDDEETDERRAEPAAPRQRARASGANGKAKAGARKASPETTGAPTGGTFFDFILGKSGPKS